MEIPYTITARPDTGLFNAKAGIWLFLASEVMLFGALFTTYILLRTGATEWPHGILNIHPSLIPCWRGASPVQATILTDDKETGVSIIVLDEKPDHGPIISQFKEEVGPLDTTDNLRRKLFERSAEVLVGLITPYVQGKITPKKQDDGKATFTTRIKKQDGFIPPEYIEKAISGERIADSEKWGVNFIKDYILSPNPYTLDCFIRAMIPWPIAWTLLRIISSGQAKRLKILKAHVDENTGYLILDIVQLEGKNSVSWEQFTEAYPNLSFIQKP